MIGIRKKVPAAIGCMSLVGIHGKAPYSWGNYFDLAVPRNKNGQIVWGGRVANMWAENLTALVKDKTLSDGMVEVMMYDDEFCIVVDPRVPVEYLYNKLCFTGSYPPRIEILQEMYEILGDPGNEIERYVSPEKYYTDRGHSYKNGIVTMRINAKLRKLKST